MATTSMSYRARQWRGLMESGLFDETYYQRVNASFQYLDADGMGFVGLKDLTERGKYIFSYLSIDVDQETAFAVMDVFRQLDRNGGGRVSIEEFVVGTAERLYLLAQDTFRLEAIGEELMQMSMHPSSLTLALKEYRKKTAADARQQQQQQQQPPEAQQQQQQQQDSASPFQMRQYRSNFQALSYLLEKRLLAMRKDGTMLSSSVLVAHIVDSIHEAVAELQSQFHVPKKWMEEVLNEETHGGHVNLLTSASIVGGSGEILRVTLPEASRYGLEAIAWNVYKEKDKSSQSPAHKGLERRGGHLLTKNLAAGGGGGGGGGSDEGGEKGVAAAGGAMTGGGAGDGSGVGGVAVTGSGDVDVFSRQNDIWKALQSLADPNATANLDPSQLFLLQTAYKALNSFFALMTEDAIVNGANQSEDAAAAASSTAAAAAGGGAAASSDLVVGKLAGLKLLLGAKNNGPIEEATNRTHSVADSVLPPYSRYNDLRVSGGPIFLGDINETNNGLLGSSKRRAVQGEGVQSELLQNLGETHEELRRAKMRLEILELVQGEMVERGLADEPLYFEGESAFRDSNSNSKQNNDANETSAMDGFGIEGEVLLKKPSAVRMSSFSSSASSATFDEIMSELAGLKGCIAERGTTNMPLGVLLEAPHAIVPLQGPSALSSLAHDLETSSRGLQEVLRRRLADEEAQSKLAFTVRMQEEQLAELSCLREQAAQERAEHLSASIELQILRGEIQRMSAELSTTKMYQSKFGELKRSVAELETALMREKAEKERHVQELSMGDGKALDAANLTIQQLQVQLEELVHDRDRLQKESNRLSNSISISDQRVKGALLDHVTLHQRLHNAEDELAGSKAYINKLLRDLEQSRGAKARNDDLTRRVNELTRDINSRDAALADARSEAAAARRQKAELAAAETHVHSLENRMAQLSIEVERGLIAIEQLDGYREQLRTKTKENRELTLQIHSLESQFKDAQASRQRHDALTDELHDYKIKVEKIPDLVAEVARLRGSSRASVKALTEQDKTLAAMKEKVRKLETDCNRLQADNRSMMDLEGKLREANAEIQRLMSMAGEVTALREEVKTVEDERRNVEAQYKKMKRLVRQDALKGEGSTTGTHNKGEGGASSSPSGNTDNNQER